MTPLFLGIIYHLHHSSDLQKTVEKFSKNQSDGAIF